MADSRYFSSANQIAALYQYTNIGISIARLDFHRCFNSSLRVRIRDNMKLDEAGCIGRYMIY